MVNVHVRTGIPVRYTKRNCTGLLSRMNLDVSSFEGAAFRHYYRALNFERVAFSSRFALVLQCHIECAGRGIVGARFRRSLRYRRR